MCVWIAVRNYETASRMAGQWYRCRNIFIIFKILSKKLVFLCGRAFRNRLDNSNDFQVSWKTSGVTMFRRRRQETFRDEEIWDFSLMLIYRGLIGWQCITAFSTYGDSENVRTKCVCGNCLFLYSTSNIFSSFCFLLYFWNVERSNEDEERQKGGNENKTSKVYEKNVMETFRKKKWIREE